MVSNLKPTQVSQVSQCSCEIVGGIQVNLWELREDVKFEKKGSRVIFSFLFSYFLKELQLILSEICYECDAPIIAPCFPFSLSSTRDFCIAALLVYFSVLERN